jgi:hypothetical protein
VSSTILAKKWLLQFALGGAKGFSKLDPNTFICDHGIDLVVVLETYGKKRSVS